jgi:hypothetical protein
MTVNFVGMGLPVSELYGDSLMKQDVQLTGKQVRCSRFCWQHFSGWSSSSKLKSIASFEIPTPEKN